jgi:hypothetical protein
MVDILLIIILGFSYPDVSVKATKKAGDLKNRRKRAMNQP